MDRGLVLLWGRALSFWVRLTHQLGPVDPPKFRRRGLCGLSCLHLLNLCHGRVPYGSDPWGGGGLGKVVAVRAHCVGTACILHTQMPGYSATM